MDEDYGAMSDPDFLAERRRVREELEHTPEHEVSPELTARYQKLDEEFLRRASLAWAQARLRNPLTERENGRCATCRNRRSRTRGPRGCSPWRCCRLTRRR